MYSDKCHCAAPKVRGEYMNHTVIQYSTLAGESSVGDQVPHQEGQENSPYEIVR
jgi:hypothetical protein